MQDEEAYLHLLWQDIWLRAYMVHDFRSASLRDVFTILIMVHAHVMPSTVGRTCHFNFPFRKNKNIPLFETLLSSLRRIYQGENKLFLSSTTPPCPVMNHRKTGMFSPTKPFWVMVVIICYWFWLDNVCYQASISLYRICVFWIVLRILFLFMP